MSATISRLPLALSAVAIIIAAVALAQTFTLSAPTSQVTPKTQTFKINIADGEVISEVDGKDVVTGEYHRFEPPVLVVHKGDTVVFQVTNMDHHRHSLVMQGCSVDTGPLNERESKTVQCVATSSGVYQFYCGIPFNPANEACAPDHATITGYLVVLE